MTRSSLMVGLVSLAQLLPLVICSLLGGSVADSFDRRRILIVTQFLLALTSVGLGANAAAGKPSVAMIFVVSAVAAGVSGFDGPARRASIPGMVKREHLVAAFALNQGLSQVTSVVGPALAGALIGLLGVPGAFFADAVTSLGALAVVFTMSAMPASGLTAPGFRAVVDGFRYLNRSAVVQGAFLADLGAMVFGMPRALFPALAANVFGGGPNIVGLLYAAPAAGALLSALTSGWTSAVRRQGLAVLWAISVWGAAITAFGFVTFLPGALALLAIAGAADVISTIFRGTLVQLAVNDDFRGRISATNMAVVAGGPRLGDAEAGLVAELAGLQVSIVSGGLLCLLSVAVLGKLRPEFPRWTRDEDSLDGQLQATPDSAAQLAAPVPEVEAPRLFTMLSEIS